MWLIGDTDTADGLIENQHNYHDASTDNCRFYITDHVMKPSIQWIHRTKHPAMQRGLSHDFAVIK